MKTGTIKSDLAKLENLLAYFEDSNRDFDLDEGLKNYEEAMKIVSQLHKSLAGYELKVKEIQAKYSETIADNKKEPGETNLN